MKKRGPKPNASLVVKDSVIKGKRRDLFPGRKSKSRLTRVDPNDGEFKRKIFDAMDLTCGNVSRAIILVNCNRRDLYKALRENPEFEKEFRTVQNMALDRAEDEVIRRGVDGVDRDVYFQGRVVGSEKIYSDYLLIRLLSAYRPQWRIGAKRTKVAISAPIPITIDFDSDSDEGD